MRQFLRSSRVSFHVQTWFRMRTEIGAFSTDRSFGINSQKVFFDICDVFHYWSTIQGTADFNILDLFILEAEKQLFDVREANQFCLRADV